MKTLITVAFILTTSLLNAQSAIEIIQKSEDLVRGKSSKADITIQINRPRWSREIRMKSWSMGTEYAMTYIMEPAKEKGTVMLKIDKEVWNWLPTIERSVKLPPSMMMQSWMGTDFTNDDLVKQSSIVVDYEHEIVGDSTILGRLCSKIELIPKEGAPVVWGKIHIWIDKENYLQLKSAMYDEDDYLINVMSAKKIGEFDGRTFVTELEMLPVEKPGNTTVLIYNNLEFDIEISKDFFTTQNMRRIR